MLFPPVLYSEDIDKISETIIQTLEKNMDISDLIEHLEKAHNLQLEDLEILVRDILDNGLQITIQELKSNYGLTQKEFRNFPSLDDLVYHDNGWTLHNAIKRHYEAYNRWRIKENLINGLLNIIATEIQRLPRTSLDFIIRELQLYVYIIIYGACNCSDNNLLESEQGICARNCGHYIIGTEDYTLPPYHSAKYKERASDHKRVWAKGCKCKYAYYDDPQDVEDIEDIDDDEHDLDDIE